jgi:hypothetical protein
MLRKVSRSSFSLSGQRLKTGSGPNGGIGMMGTGRWERMPEMECRICQTHAGVCGFPAGSGEVIEVSSQIRLKPTLGLSLWPDTERDSAGIPRIPAGSLFLSFSVTNQCAWVPDLSSSLFLCHQSDLSNLFFFFESYQTILINLISKN